MDRALFEKALEALEYAAERIGCPDDDDAIGVARKALRERLAQPVGSARCPRCWEPITPAASKPWVGLTDEEIDQGLLRSDYAFKTAEAWRAGVVFAMTKLKEKNNA